MTTPRPTTAGSSSSPRDGCRRRSARYLKGGKLRKIKVTQRGASPRIVYATLISSAGKTRVSGPTLKAALGLRDTWAFFKKLKH